MLEGLGVSVAFELISQTAKYFGVSPEDVRERLSKAIKKRQTSKKHELAKSHAIKRENIAASGLSNSLILRYYEDSIKQQEGIDFFSVTQKGEWISTTFATKPSWTIGAVNLKKNKIASLWGQEIVEESIEYEEGIESLEQIISSGSRLWNDPIYRLQQVSDDIQNFQVEFSIDNFFNYRLGIGRLNDEIIDSLIVADKKDELLTKEGRFLQGAFKDQMLSHVIENKEKLLPLRHRYLPDVQSIQSPNKRMCAGGISVLIAAKEKSKGYKLFLHRRGEKVSENRKALGVFPHAFHQPLIDPVHDIQIDKSALREIYEELFGGDETVSTNKELFIDPEWFYSKSPPLKWLKENPSKWSVHCTGFGYNLVSGNYDFAILLCIHSPAFLERFGSEMKVNWEVATKQMIVGGIVYNTNLPIIETVNSLNQEQLSNILSNARWTSVGLFSFVQGVRFLAQLDPQSVMLPDLTTSTQ